MPVKKNADPNAAWSSNLVELRARPYVAADFIIPAADQKGHSERQWFRCQPGHDRMMDTVIQGKRFPFRTKGDFIRWCIWIGLQVLEGLQPDMPSITRQVDLIIQMVRDDEFQAEMESVFKQVGDRVAHHMTDNNGGEARKLIARVRHAIEQMPEGNWRERYQARYDKQFAAYLKSGETDKHMMVKSGGPMTGVKGSGRLEE